MELAQTLISMCLAGDFAICTILPFGLDIALKLFLITSMHTLSLEE
jgi:hypothetical protein